LTPLAASDAEDELADWLDEHGVRGAWELAPTLVAAGIDSGWLSQVDAAVGGDDVESAIRWIAYPSTPSC
ncbi:histidine kinase, partial [Micromonospora sp. NPDC003776]